jgi:DNA-binding NtrC family response regulator
MIRVCLFSEDHTLQSILSSALGKEFRVQVQSQESGVNNTLTAGECDLVLLDLDSEQDRLEDWLKSCHRIIASRVPVIAMVDDRMRSAAIDLVKAGAHG